MKNRDIRWIKRIMGYYSDIFRYKENDDRDIIRWIERIMGYHLNMIRYRENDDGDARYIKRIMGYSMYECQ